MVRDAPSCSASQSPALRLAVIGYFRLTLGETIGILGLTPSDPVLTLGETDLQSSALAHAM